MQLNKSYNADDASCKCQAPEETLHATISTVGSGTDDCADDYEQSGSHKGSLPANSVANEADKKADRELRLKIKKN